MFSKKNVKVLANKPNHSWGIALLERWILTTIKGTMFIDDYGVSLVHQWRPQFPYGMDMVIFTPQFAIFTAEFANCLPHSLPL